MVEILKDNNEINLPNNVTQFNFKDSLSKVKEIEQKPLPEGFSYDSEGYIICERDLFTYEDYKKYKENNKSGKTPIDELLGNMIKKGEYRGIDYSNCNQDYTKIVKGEYKKQLFLFLGNANGRVIIEGQNNQPIMLLKGTKIIPPHDEYMKFIGYKGNISKNKEIVKNLNKYFISFSDVRSFFGEEKTESEIFEILKNINFDDNIDEQTKTQILGEYSNTIEPVSVLLGLILISLKNKIGNTLFYKHIGDFTKIFNFNPILSFGPINTYLHSGYCTITQENMDEYLDFITEKQGGIYKDLQGYTLDEAKILKKYGYEINNNIVRAGNFAKRLKNIENNGITPKMFKFAKFKFPYGDLSVDNAEELFIDEKEGINLFYFLSKFPQKLQNLGGKEIKEIDLNTEKRNFCFRGILEMIKSRGDINVLPYPGENAKSEELNKRKESWEKIIKEYENLLRNYISLDKDEKGNEIPRKQTFDKIFYSIANGKEDRNGALINEFDKEDLQLFSENAISDYSNTIDENGKLDQSNGKKMLKYICEYAAADQHKNEKILVYIGAHGGEEGESGNGWTKEDWLTISKYPNVKIMTTRCFFGTAYNNENNGSGDYIYDQPSTFSGFSNKTVATASTDTYLKDGVNLGLGFHELQLYVRSKYGISSPLTESIEYQDRNTGEKKKRNIGLAYEGEGDAFYNIV